MELNDIVRLYRRWSWLLVAGLIIGVICGLLVSIVQPPVYEASAKVLVAKNRQQGSDEIMSLSDAQLVATYQQLVKTRPVVDQAAQQLGIKIDPASIHSEVLTSTQIIRITVSNRDAAQAAAIANALVHVLIDQNETLQAGRYGAYEDGLNVQISQVQKQITDLQSQISQINQANIQEQLDQVNKQAAALQEQIAALQQGISDTPDTGTPAVRASLAEKQAQLTQLRSLLSLYQEIQTNLIYIGKPVSAGNTLTDPKVVSLQSTLNLYQQLYANLLNSLEAVKLARLQGTPTVSQIDEALAPKQPVKPLPVLYVLVAGLAGLVLAAATVLVIDLMAGTFASAQQARQLLHTPVLSQIVDSKQRRNWLPRPPRGPDTHILVENAFASLRVNLQRLMRDTTNKSVLVTSTWRGDGKTTVAVDLAKSFADTGQTVILVDANFVHPQVHARFGLENHMGLVDILSNGMDWQEVTTTQEKVTVITSGAVSPAKQGLLESDRMADLLEKLQRKADIVIVDGPSLFRANGQTLASRVGAVLLVIQPGMTKISAARALKAQLDLTDADLLGIVVNRVPREDADYYDGYYFEEAPESPKDQVLEVEAA